jgi:hypothetical protein
MRARFQIENADQVEATLSVTMPIKDWKRFREQLPSAFPSWEFAAKIVHMIQVAEAKWSDSHEDQDGVA